MLSEKAVGQPCPNAQSDDLQITNIIFSLNIRNCDPPFELELYRASPELALKGGVTGNSSKKSRTK
jgi:hypothetical protein